MCNFVLGNFKKLCNIVFTKCIPDFEHYYNKKNQSNKLEVQKETVDICGNFV